MQYAPTAAQALGGSNRDVVANRAAIRMANMSARDMLKAEQGGGALPAKPELFPVKPEPVLPAKPVAAIEADVIMESGPAADGEDEFPGFGGHDTPDVGNGIVQTSEENMVVTDAQADGEANPEPEVQSAADTEVDKFLSGVKRKIDEVDNDPDATVDEDTPEDPAITSKTLVVNPDGTVEQEDTIQ